MPTTLRAESTQHSETPPEKVFEVIDTPDRYFDRSPQLRENHDAQAKPAAVPAGGHGGGHDIGYVFEMNGRPLTGSARVQEHAPRHMSDRRAATCSQRNQRIRSRQLAA